MANQDMFMLYFYLSYIIVKLLVRRFSKYVAGGLPGVRELIFGGFSGTFLNKRTLVFKQN